MGLFDDLKTPQSGPPANPGGIDDLKTPPSGTPANPGVFDDLKTTPSGLAAVHTRPPTDEEWAKHSEMMQRDADNQWNNGGLQGKARAGVIKGVEWLRDNVDRNSLTGKTGHELASGFFSLPIMPPDILATYEGMRSPRVTETGDGQPPELAPPAFNNSHTGAVVRSLGHNLLPAAAGAVTGTVGTAVGTPWLGVPSAIAGSVAAAKLQESLLPRSDRQMEQAAYDEANDKASVMAGEALPALLTLKPDVARFSATLGQRAVGAGLGGGVPAVMDAVTGQPFDAARALSGAAQGALMTPNKLGKALDSKFSNSWFNPEYRTDTAANKQIRSEVDAILPTQEAKNKALAQIKQARDAGLSGDGFNTLTGDAVFDFGAYQKYASSRDPSNGLANQHNANQIAVNKGVGKAMERTAGSVDEAGNFTPSDQAAPIKPSDPGLLTNGVDPEEAGKFFAGDQAAQLKAMHDRIAALEANKAEANTDLQTEQAPIAAAKGTQNGASEELHNMVASDLAAKDIARAEAFDLGADGGRHVPDLSTLHEAARATREKIGPIDRTPSTIAPFIGEQVEAILKQEKSGAPVTYQQLSDTRSVLAKAVAAARKDNSLTGPAIQRVVDLKNAAQGILNELPSGQEGLAYYKGTYVDRFKKGVGGDIAQQIGNNTAKPEDTGSRMLKPDSASAPGKTAEQLALIVEGSSSPEKAQKSVRDYLVGVMADHVTDSEGRVNPKKLREWMQGNTEALKRFPAVQSEIAQMSDRLNSKSAKVGQFETDLNEASSEKSALEAAHKSDAGTPFISAAPQKAVSSIMEGQNPLADMRAAFNSASKDKTGKASEGLKNAVKQWLNEAVRGTKDRKSSNDPSEKVNLNDKDVLHGYLSEILVDPRKRAALEHAFSPDEIKALDVANRRLQISTHRSDGQMGAGSSTSTDAAKAAALAPGASVADGLRYVILGGRSEHVNHGVMRTLIETMERAAKGNVGIKANELRTRILSEPELAVDAIKPLSKDSFPKMKDKLFRYRALPLGKQGNPYDAKDEEDK